MLSYGFWLLQSCAVHHYAVGMASGCSGDGWSSRSLQVQSPDSEFTVGMAQQKRRESKVTWFDGVKAEVMFLCRCTYFVLLVSCCRSTLLCDWFTSSRVVRGSIGCSCWRLVLTPVHWFLEGTDYSRIKTCWAFSSFFSLYISTGPKKKCINYMNYMRAPEEDQLVINIH